MPSYKSVYFTRPEGEPKVDSDGKYLYACAIGLRDDGLAYYLKIRAESCEDKKNLRMREVYALRLMRKGLDAKLSGEMQAAEGINTVEELISSGHLKDSIAPSIDGWKKVEWEFERIDFSTDPCWEPLDTVAK